MKTDHRLDKRINAKKYLANFVDIQNAYKIIKEGVDISRLYQSF